MRLVYLLLNGYVVYDLTKASRYSTLKLNTYINKYMYVCTYVFEREMKLWS